MLSNKNISLEYSGLHYTTSEDDWVNFLKGQVITKTPRKNLRKFLEKKCQQYPLVSYSLDDTMDAECWQDMLDDF